MVSLTLSLWHGLFDTVELRFPGINRPFDYHFANLRIFFKSCKILLYLYLLFLKLVHFCMFIVQNSSKKFTFLQIFSYLKNSPWNLKISYILRLSPLCMNEEGNKIFYRSILEQCDIQHFPLRFCHSVYEQICLCWKYFQR